jgi:hypothetical protein
MSNNQMLFDFGNLYPFLLKLQVQHWDKRIQLNTVQEKIAAIVVDIRATPLPEYKEACLKNIHLLNDIYAYIHRGNAFTIHKYKLQLVNDPTIENEIHSIQQLR